ncbi:MAG: hypothetical protein KUG68_08415 [Flavobacteriaceae bacterium]|nr:hypothetical protein [Flavobacteriaceae bacterium]
MELLLFQTNIESRKKVALLTPMFNKHTEILKWSVDLEDIDHVLRIEATPSLSEIDVIELVQLQGIKIEVLEG